LSPVIDILIDIVCIRRRADSGRNQQMVGNRRIV